MAYRLEITDEAGRLLDDIINYILRKFKNPKAAGDLLDAIEHVFCRIADNPKIYQMCEDLYLKSMGYRKAPVGNYQYVILYRVDDEKQTIYVSGIFHDLENYKSKL